METKLKLIFQIKGPILHYGKNLYKLIEKKCSNKQWQNTIIRVHQKWNSKDIKHMEKYSTSHKIKYMQNELKLEQFQTVILKF